MRKVNDTAVMYKLCDDWCVMGCTMTFVMCAMIRMQGMMLRHDLKCTPILTVCDVRRVMPRMITSHVP